MNYLCHARNVLDRPWTLAGTALPDWLAVTNRRARLREGDIPESGPRDDEMRRDLLDGLRLHFVDDAWFHRTPAFTEVTRAISLRIRESFADRRLRSGFVAHIMLEMLLDAWLVEQRPGIADQYEAALDAVDVERLAVEAADVLSVDTRGLPGFIPRFRAARLLDSYKTDEGVVLRLNGVRMRVRLGPLPRDFPGIVQHARGLIRDRAEDLLTPTP